MNQDKSEIFVKNFEFNHPGSRDPSQPRTQVMNKSKGLIKVRHMILGK